MVQCMLHLGECMREKDVYSATVEYSVLQMSIMSHGLTALLDLP